jgi:MscS family membrane protein
LALIVLAFAFLGGAHALAQGESESQAEPEEAPPWSDPLGRDTPRGALRGFLEAVDEGDLERAAEYLDLRNLPKRVRDHPGPELAAGFSLVLERALWVDLDDLSDHPDGAAADGLPSYRDELAKVKTDAGEISILLQRVPAADGEFVWKVSNATIARMPQLYAEYRYAPYTEWLSQNLPEVEWLGVELFKWVGALSVAAAAYPFILLATWWIARTISHPGSEGRCMTSVSGLVHSATSAAARSSLCVPSGYCCQGSTSAATCMRVISVGTNGRAQRRSCDPSPMR